MPNPNYVRGRSGEYYIINLFEGRGYNCLRSAGSHSPVDILAARGRSIEKNLVFAIQVKKSKKNRMTAEDDEKLIQFAQTFNATPIEAFKQSDGKWGFRDVVLNMPFIIP